MRRSKSGFTLVELLVVISIIGILMGLLMPVMSTMRESTRSTQCKNNLKQLAVAMQQCEENQSYLPTYFGYFPPETSRRLRGSWFAHLLPYLEGAGEHAEMMNNTNSSYVKSESGAWVMVKPASPDYVPGYWDQNGGRDVPNEQPGSPITTEHVGHTYTVNPPSTGTRREGPPATYVGGKGQGPQYAHDPAGNFTGVEAFSNAAFAVTSCLSDPSTIKPGQLVTWNKNSGDKDRQWSLTNYFANAQALALPTNKTGSGVERIKHPTRTQAMGDGASNTILLAEGMRVCDSTFRIALWSQSEYQHSHNFAIDWNGKFNTLMFQASPDIRRCNNWRLQANHGQTLNVAMADGSVRAISNSISRQETTDPDTDGAQIGEDPKFGSTSATWDRLITPNDGMPIKDSF